MEKLNLSSHYTIKNILRQCASPVFMMLFISIYGVVDGLFVANFVSENAFAGINLIFPVICIVGGSGYMLGSGGSALASKFLGEKNGEQANRVFSMMVYFGFILGVVLSAITFPFINNLVDALASLSPTSTEEMKETAILYGRILMCSQPFYIVSSLFQNFFVVDEKQKVGFAFTLASGVANMIFDALFIIVFKWGVAGAAIATIIGHIIGSIGPILYFQFNKNDLIKLVKTNLDFKIIGQCSFNGLSDFIFNISASIIGIIYNIQLLKYIGQVGVMADGVIMYVSFIFISIFIGIIIGMGPVIGYNYGAKNDKELKFAIKNSFIILGIISIIMFIVSEIFAGLLARLFSQDPETIIVIEKALRIYSVSFLFMGFSIYITGMFTSLNNGVISGIISLFRSFCFPIIFIIVLPIIFGGSLGIWISIIFTEVMSIILGIVLLETNRKKYHY